jgi:hypothetical protein
MKKTDEELKQIAVDLYDGKIFSDHHFRSDVDAQSMFGSVFMAFILSNVSVKDIAFVYEYLDKAGTHSINGYPIFLSCRYLYKDDAKRMFGFYDEYKKLKDSFMVKK